MSDDKLAALVALRWYRTVRTIAYCCFGWGVATRSWSLVETGSALYIASVVLRKEADARVARLYELIEKEQTP
jgi:hypothetical protein